MCYVQSQKHDPDILHFVMEYGSSHLLNRDKELKIFRQTASNIEGNGCDGLTTGLDLLPQQRAKLTSGSGLSRDDPASSSLFLILGMGNRLAWQHVPPSQ